jgi:MerR HTH family regulatory protein
MTKARPKTYHPASRFIADCGGHVPKRKPKGERWKDYLTRRDLQRRLGISSATIARMDARGELPPSITWGGVRLYQIKDIEKFEREWFQPRRPKR